MIEKHYKKNETASWDYHILYVYIGTFPVAYKNRTDFDPLAHHGQQKMTKYQRQMLVNNDVTINRMGKKHYHASPLGLSQYNLLVSILCGRLNLHPELQWHHTYESEIHTEVTSITNNAYGITKMVGRSGKWELSYTISIHS